MYDLDWKTTKVNETLIMLEDESKMAKNVQQRVFAGGRPPDYHPAGTLVQ
jgi:hypothetical protein